MKWYTLQWEDHEIGWQVEHFTRKSEGERRIKELPEISSYSQHLNLQENSVSNRRELVEWLNNNFNTSNG